MSARQHVASAALPSGSSVDAWTTPAVSPEHVYQTMPPLAQDDADALERSIRTHGIQTPIIVDEHGNIIDGHHRREIATRCGLPLPVEVRRDLDESTKVALSISLNVDRRQLTREQKREIIAASIKAAPEVTDREHARRTGASPSTVGAVRDELESSGDVSKLDTRTDSLGRQQPASKPAPVVSITHRQSESTTETYDAATVDALPQGDISGTIAALVAEFPDLAYYSEKGDTTSVLRVGGALHGYDEPELSSRLEALSKTIAYYRRQDQTPKAAKPVGPDYAALADLIFTAANEAAAAIERAGGIATIQAAVSGAEQIRIELWRDQFNDLRTLMGDLAEATKPKLRSVK